MDVSMGGRVAEELGINLIMFIIIFFTRIFKTYIISSIRNG